MDLGPKTVQPCQAFIWVSKQSNPVEFLSEAQTNSALLSSQSF